MKKLTVKEIAKMAGVSVTSVSFVLNNKPGVSETTRKKVQRIIEETGFKPNLNSKKLVMNKSFNICLVINSFSSPFEDLFYFEITRGILNQSIKRDYNITICKSAESKNELPDLVYSGDTDGIIFMQDISEELMDKVVSSGVPAIIVDSHSVNDKITSLTPDYYRATYDATEHLIARGHEKIALIASETEANFHKQTLAGFKSAMEDNNIVIIPEFYGLSAVSEDGAYQVAKKILSGDNLPTAIVCTVDRFAIGAMRCAKDLGFNVPEDISFVGIDDILLSRYVEPRLTTIGIDKVAMGELAIDMLLKEIEGGKSESVLLPMNLISRDSVLDLRK